MWLKGLRPRQNGRHFPDDIFKCIFVSENVWMPIQISFKFVPKGPMNNIPTLVQIMAWRSPGDKPLSESMMVSLPTHICVTRPQWVMGLIMGRCALLTSTPEFVLSPRRAIVSLNGEQSQSALPCHHVILVANIAIAPTPGRESSRASFLGTQSVLVELHQSGVIAWRQRRRSCGVFKSWISVAHCPFQWK